MFAGMLFALAAGAQADPITTLFNTGVDNTGTSRLDNDFELHYSLIAGPVMGTPFVATSAGGFPIPPWIGDNSISAHIAPSQNTDAPGGVYTYRTLFDLTGFDPVSALLQGNWTMDNNGLDILLNGNSLGFTHPSDLLYAPFTINSGFVAGANTLDFVVNNVSGATGLRVEVIGTANPVPEPTSLVFASIALAGAGAMRRRKI